MRLYRILPEVPPKAEHFFSYEALGKPVPEDTPDEVKRKWPGVSTYTTLERAARTVRSASRRARLGGFYALLIMPEGTDFEEDEDQADGRHVTVKGVTPELLLSYVIEFGPLPLPPTRV